MEEERLKKSSMSPTSSPLGFRIGDGVFRVKRFLTCPVQILVYQMVYCCCGVGGCLAASTPGSSWLSNKFLVSGYWLLSKGIWWTLWTCVFRFPF